MVVYFHCNSWEDTFITIQVTASFDPRWTRDLSHSFLVAEPILNNLILTLLESRIAFPEEGRYLVASDGGKVIGVALQSPMNFDLNLTRMSSEAVEAMVEATSEIAPPLCGVTGEAFTAARFAGQWSERNKKAATPCQGMRIYEVDEVRLDERNVKGYLRQAVAADRALVIEMIRGFYADIGEHNGNAERVVDARLPSRQYWLWEDGVPVSLSAKSLPVAGVVRVQAAYTRPAARNRGYGRACVGALSKQVREEGFRCMLYTDLANPVSNSTFRRLGYRCVAEALRYRFG
jgi:uncharacterized protein